MRLGLIGYGTWARKALARNLAKHTELVWVHDPSPEAMSAATQAGFRVEPEPVWDSVDAVAIATPIETHPALAAEALERGKHVLCEKPLACTEREARELTELAYVRGLCLYTDFTWTHHAAIQRGAQVARELGRPLWFRSARTSWDERGLDPISDLLPHDVSILRLWTRQSVAEVSAVVSGETACITMVTDAGVIGTNQVGYRDRTKRRTTWLGCERGIVRTAGDEAWVSRDDPKDLSYWQIDSGDTAEPLDAMCAEFVRRVDMGEPGNTHEALEVARVIEAAHLSIRERRVVTL